MSRYTITESVGNRVERVHSFEDLEKHHPSSGREPGRDYATIDGELEEVRLQGGRTYVKKDFILSQDTPGPVYIPAPASGYVHYLNDATNAVRIYDQPFGTPGAVMLAQSLHMARNTSPPQGSFVQYGAPLGQMGDTGSPGSVHAHVEVEVAQFRRYIGDMVNGTIQPGVIDPLADGVLRHGEQGTPVRELQQQLNRLGMRDAQGGAIEADGDFGRRTREAVQAFQRSRGLEPDGIAGRDTLAAVWQAPGLTATAQSRSAAKTLPEATPAPAAARSAEDYGPTPLSNLIGSGEGSYNAYNRGRAGDSVGREMDFSRMTVGEVMRRQALPRSNPEALFAAGKFQMIPGTLRETVDALGVDRNAYFTPQLQERMFADYLIDEKRPAIRAYITGRSEGAQGLQRAQVALAQEFASVADPRTGRSYYAGDSAGNSSSITAAESARALDAMRQQYHTNIARGLMPDAAYRGLSGAAPVQDPLADDVLRQGERGDAVRALQEQLNRLGARDLQGRALEPDGDFGRRTGEAVAAFQRSRELEPDGIAGRDTLSALRRAALEPVTTQPATPPGAPVIPTLAPIERSETTVEHSRSLEQSNADVRGLHYQPNRVGYPVGAASPSAQDGDGGQCIGQTTRFGGEGAGDAINTHAVEQEALAAPEIVKQRGAAEVERHVEPLPTAGDSGVNRTGIPGSSKVDLTGSNSEVSQTSSRNLGEQRSHPARTTSFVERLLEAARRNDAGAIDDAAREMLASETGRAWKNEGHHRLQTDAQPLAQTPSHDPSVDMSR